MTGYTPYVLRSMLTGNQCSKLIDHLENQEDTKREPEGGHVYSDLSYDDKSFDWLYDKCWAKVISFNDSRNGWRFLIDDWQQELRIARYDTGAGMDWHCDYTNDDASKIAFSTALSSPHDYVGGQLSLLEAPSVPALLEGQAAIFPAFHGHKVSPVTEGSRYVLLGWLTGPRFI